MAQDPNERIVKMPGTCGGKPVSRAIACERRTSSSGMHHGMSPDEIVSHIPSITLADVHSALAYYFDHIQEIQEEMRADRAYAEEFRRNHPSLLGEKLGQ